MTDPFVRIEGVSKMFGTFQPELDEERCRYGIVKNLGTWNPLRISLHEWWGIAKDVAGSKSPKDALGYIFAPPGWSPDGSRMTSKTIKEIWEAERRDGEARSDSEATAGSRLPAE